LEIPLLTFFSSLFIQRRCFLGPRRFFFLPFMCSTPLWSYFSPARPQSPQLRVSGLPASYATPLLLSSLHLAWHLKAVFPFKLNFSLFRAVPLAFSKCFLHKNVSSPLSPTRVAGDETSPPEFPVHQLACPLLLPLLIIPSEIECFFYPSFLIDSFSRAELHSLNSVPLFWHTGLFSAPLTF